MKSIFAFLMIILFTSCSNNKKTDEIPLSDPETASDENSDFVLETDSVMANNSIVNSDVGPNITSEAVATDNQEVKTETLTKSNESDGNSEVVIGDSAVLTNAIEEYTASDGDSLMWLAFKIYGDYAKWKSLLDLNPQKGRGHFKNGEKIRYYVPSERFVWEPKGLPYLIKNKDSLASISKDKYGTTKKWKAIFDNNRPMIKHPNLIFAGFTLYYLEDVRDLASE